MTKHSHTTTLFPISLCIYQSIPNKVEMSNTSKEVAQYMIYVVCYEHTSSFTMLNSSSGLLSSGPFEIIRNLGSIDCYITLTNVSTNLLIGKLTHVADSTCNLPTW